MMDAREKSLTKFKVVVPARYASTRLPAKPLLDLGGKPMVVAWLNAADCRAPRRSGWPRTIPTCWRRRNGTACLR